jgi:hypothetical protein
MEDTSIGNQKNRQINGQMKNDQRTNNGRMKNDENTYKRWKIPAWVIRRTEKSMPLTCLVF